MLHPIMIRALLARGSQFPCTRPRSSSCPVTHRMGNCLLAAGEYFVYSNCFKILWTLLLTVTNILYRIPLVVFLLSFLSIVTEKWSIVVLMSDRVVRRIALVSSAFIQSPLLDRMGINSSYRAMKPIPTGNLMTIKSTICPIGPHDHTSQSFDHALKFDGRCSRIEAP